MIRRATPRGAGLVALVVPLTLLAGLPACSSDDTVAPASTTLTPTTVSSTPETLDPNEGGGGSAPAVASMADVDFENFTYDIGIAVSEDGGTTELDVTDGVYSSGDDVDSTYLEVSDVDIADFDGDGVDDAAVSIFYSTGGTGRFTDVLVFRLVAGVPTQVTSDGVGDRGDGGVDDVRTEPAPDGVGAVLVIRRNADAEGACCPTALEERRLRLKGDELVAVGDAEKWAIVRVGVDEEGAPTSEPSPIEFLPGTSRADITGDATTPIAATFDATAGQTLSLQLDAAALAENPLTIVVTGPAGEVGRVGAGVEPALIARLSATGTYRLQIEPTADADPELGVYFDADLRIT